MAAIRHLTRAPITEALFDIRAIPSKDFDSERLKQAPARLRETFPGSQERRASEAQLAFQPGAAPKASSRDLGFQGVWVRSSDEKEIAQFRVDGFTFNRLHPYTSWDSLLPKALDLWALYVELAKPASTSRVAVRYINHLPLKTSPADLDDFIVTSPPLPRGVPDLMSQFSTRVVMVERAKGLNAAVTQALEVGVQTTTPTLLLDIDAFKIAELKTDRSVLEATFTELREYKNKIFFGSLTEEYARSFE